MFTTEAIENIPAGWRARETYILEEIFELAPPGKDFELYSRNRLTRVKWAFGRRSALPRVDVDADHAILPRGPFLRAALKTIESLDDTDVSESHAAQHVDKLCLRQSTGDSTRPEIDIPSHRL